VTDPRRRLAGLLGLAAVLVAACAGGPSPSSVPGPSTPSPSASPGPVGFVIHASWTQALPPRALFSNLPAVVVTTDGRVLAPGPVDEIYPGPLVARIVERSITPRGVDTLLRDARDLGLLRADGDFTGGQLPLGAAAGRLRIVVDGVTYDLVGDTAAAPCPPTEACPDPGPGTPAAFATFWARLLDLGSRLAAELGPEAEHAPAAYAVIVGPPPEPWQGAVPVVWPLADPALDAFGSPVRGEPGVRCGVAAGDLATALAPAFDGAHQLAPFVATAIASATHQLTVRPLLPGDDDPCYAIVE
jgi:hypothetical protein